MFYVLVTLKTSSALVAIAIISFSFHDDLTVFFLKNFVVTMSAELIFLDKTALIESPVAVTPPGVLELSLFLVFAVACWHFIMAR